MNFKYNTMKVTQTIVLIILLTLAMAGMVIYFHNGLPAKGTPAMDLIYVCIGIASALLQ